MPQGQQGRYHYHSHCQSHWALTLTWLVLHEPTLTRQVVHEPPLPWNVQNEPKVAQSVMVCSAPALD